jgi:hypothetical protein
VNRSGQPLAGVDAALFKGCPETNDACAKQPLLGGPARMVVSEDTGTNGHATLAPYRPGTYRLCLFAYYGAAPGHPTATGYADTCAAEPITIPKAGQAGTVKVVLARAGAVTGIVIDKAGHRLAGVRMHISGSAADDFGSPITHFFGDEMSPALEAYTDAHGRFLIRSVQPGRQRMRGRGHRVGRVLVRARRVTRHVRVVISRPPPSRDMGTAPDTAAPRRARPVPSQPRRVPAPWWRTVAS